MIIECYRNVLKGNLVRENLIEIKKELKEPENKRAFAYEVAGNFSAILCLLKEEDPKIRKNAALILGEMECEDLLDPLFDAYNIEETLFIRGDYLKAICHYDYRKLLPVLEEKLEILRKAKADESSAKHVREEAAQLQAMILKFEKPKKHKFTGVHQPSEVILLTNRNHREVVSAQVSGGIKKMLAGGIRIENADLREILPLRTYQELLFVIKGCNTLSGTPKEMADTLYKSGLLKFLEKNHEGSGAFYFRIGAKGKLDTDQKSRFVKKISAALEERFQGKLLNAPSDYELEIRLIENKDGAWIPLLKLGTIEDHRFDYRKECLATSISPVNAALIMELVKEYLKESAQVLDPFCGVGTMLIERNQQVKARTMYGLDILDEAITKARENTRIAGLPIHYIQRDFYDFSHEYLFDEIITNMPGMSRSRDELALQQLYDRFLERATELLKTDGCIILYSENRRILMISLRKQKDFILKKTITINDREDRTVFLLERV